MGVRYIWYKNLYFGEKAAKHKKTLLSRLKKGRCRPDVFLLTLPESRERDILHICRAIEFKQKFYDGAVRYVVGIAEGKDEAVDIATELIDSMYKRQGNFDIRSFLEFSEQEV